MACSACFAENEQHDSKTVAASVKIRYACEDMVFHYTGRMVGVNKYVANI